MASSRLIAQRYTKGLTSFLNENSGKFKETLEALQGASEMIEGSSELKELLSSPQFSEAQRSEVLKLVLVKANLPEPVQNFILLLSKNNRIAVLNDISKEFKDIVLKKENRVEAFIESALPMEKDEVNELCASLEKLFKQKVLPQVKVVPSLIAGVKVKVLNKTLDASLRSNLELLQKKLLGSDQIAKA